MKRAAIYGRVSSEKQEDEGTIDSQVAALEDAISSAGDILVDKYLDNGYSGTLLSRPDLDRLRDDVAQGIIDVVYIHSPDRLARRYVYQEIVLEELKGKGVEVIFLNRRVAETPEDNLLLGVQGIIAEYERAKFMERTRRGKLHRAKGGHIIGNIPPYGYHCVKKHDSQTGFAHYTIDEQEAITVRLMFYMLVERRMTEYAIVRELNEKGIKPRKGDRWAKSSVARILRNSTYAGTTHYNKYYATQPTKQSHNHEIKYSRRKNTSTRLRPKDQWIAIEGVPEIIPQSTFERAQSQLDDNSRFSVRNAKQSYLLKGLVRCGIDSRAYYGVPMHGKPFYRCSGKNKLVSELGCISASVSASMIEPAVWNMIVELVNDPKLILDQLKKRDNSKSVKIVAMNDQIKQAEDFKARLKIEEQRMMDAYGSGALSLEQLKNANQSIQLRMNKYDEDQRNLSKLKVSTSIDRGVKKSVSFYMRNVRKVLNKFDFSKRQEFLRLLLDEVVLNSGSIILRGAVPVPVLASNVTLSPQSADVGAAREW